MATDKKTSEKKTPEKKTVMKKAPEKKTTVKKAPAKKAATSRKSVQKGSERGGLWQEYNERIVPELMTKMGVKNVMQVPRLTKITINMGLGEDARDKNIYESVSEQLSLISGQKPIMTRAHKSIAGFSIRDGWPLGCKVTLRRAAMYNFFARLIWIAIPRIRDFRGFNRNSFDGRGNYSLGLKEQIIFPEIDYGRIDRLRGMDIAITTSAPTDELATMLFEQFNFPLKRPN